MGNTPSRGSSVSQGGGPHSSSAASYPDSASANKPTSTPHHVHASSEGLPPPPRKPKRRESTSFSATLHTNKAKPSATLESAEVPPSSHSSTQSAQESLRSQTVGYPLTPTSSHHQHADSASQDDMGNQESKPKQQHKRVQSSPAKASPLPKPIDIAAPSDKHIAEHLPFEAEQTSPNVGKPPSLTESYQLPSAQYSRPPRLPLPIEEELHTPGSPILSPADVAAVEPLDGLPRRSSVLSSTTDADEDIGDLEAVAGGLHPPVPTLIEWREGGEKVYVTGTFAGWDRKFRLHKNGPSKQPGALSATIHLQPGTHHVRFIVDNDLKLSTFMPTAVDFTNYLVNYIEVVPEKVVPPTEGTDVPPGSEQLPTAAQPSQPRPIEYRAPPGVHPPHILPPTPELVAIPLKEGTAKSTGDPKATPTSQSTPVAPVAPKRYHSVIPKFLLDLDASEDSPEYVRANQVLGTAPAPPSLPMFLNKSILNGTTPMKDDASVLNMPNHTMLNHLATSSIKNKVLATSATTRYKRKFLTTIMYKPTSAVGE